MTSYFGSSPDGSTDQPPAPSTDQSQVDTSHYLPAPPSVAPYWTEPQVVPTEVPESPIWEVIGGPVSPRDGSSRRSWRRWTPRGLSARLVAGVVALVVVLVLATSMGTYVALRSFLLNRLDQQLTATASREAILNLLQQSQSPRSAFSVPQKVWVEILDPAGQPTSLQLSGAIFQPLRVSESDRVGLAKGTSQPRSVQTSAGDRIRLVAVTGLAQQSVDPASGVVTRQPVTVLIGLSQAEVDRTLSRLVKLEVVIGLSAILVALAATSYGVRYSLRHLRSVTTTARGVAEELSPSGAGLERRVEVREPGTEVGQLAESMNTLLSAVETQFAERVASEERMRQFLADASHELRTPLTSIRGYAELSRMQGNGDSDNLSRIEAEGLRMSRLVDDLLTLARTDQRGEQQHEVLDVSDVLAEAVDGVRAAHPQRQIELVTEPGLLVSGDRDQLVRVVRNLATNAAVHTRPDGPIRVTGSHEQDSVVIRVVDAGPGLPPEEAAHVFERFWRADKARTRTKGGSGLGMSIVAALVQGHGGAVHFDSTVAGGSTVTVRLPRI